MHWFFLRFSLSADEVIHHLESALAALRLLTEGHSPLLIEKRKQ